MLAELLRSVAITCEGWVDVLERLHVHWPSPYECFVLFDPRVMDRALALLPSEGYTRVAERVSADPVNDGYVAGIELSWSLYGGEPLATMVDAFIAREAARTMEPYLRSVYGDRRPDAGELLYAIDYPVFDNGTCGVAFGVAMERGRRRVWLWSRASFAHK